MSKELDYLPPNKTKFEWGSKTLNYSPWRCNLSHQREPKLFLWPASVDLSVDLCDGKYWWGMLAYDFSHRKVLKTGFSKDPLKACLKAEKVGEAMLDKLLPDWARTALKNKWRSPA